MMKKLLLCMAVVFAFAITSAAQETNPQTSNPAPSTRSSSGNKETKAASSTGTRTTTGCIEKSDDLFMLKSGRYRQGVKVTGSDDLAPHVGHTVRLTGTWTVPGQEFAESRIEMVSDSCKLGTGSTSSTEKKKGSSSGTAGGSTPPPGF
ncbi:MAG TPA: hypothetical protein VKB56_08060 [Terriglobales bacterium]|nr:hypothetical protein [Terriglobales bacterium]